MSNFEKALERIKSIPKDYTYSEMTNLLKMLGFVQMKQGKTGGSRRKFYRDYDKRIFMCHQPHPKDVMPAYATKKFMEFLKGIGEL